MTRSMKTLAVATVFVATLTGARGAMATTCQLTSASWTQTLNTCLGHASVWFGDVSFGSKRLNVRALAGGGNKSASVAAIASNGMLILPCSVTDKTPGDAGVSVGGSASTVCQLGVRYLAQVTF